MASTTKQSEVNGLVANLTNKIITGTYSGQHELQALALKIKAELKHIEAEPNHLEALVEAEAKKIEAKIKAESEGIFAEVCCTSATASLAASTPRGFSAPRLSSAAQSSRRGL